MPLFMRGDRLWGMREPKVWSALALAALVCLRLSAQTAPATTAIVGGTVIDGTGGAPIADAVVLLFGARISSVGSRRLKELRIGTEYLLKPAIPLANLGHMNDANAGAIVFQLTNIATVLRQILDELKTMNQTKGRK
jgi:hypothetical protein